MVENPSKTLKRHNLENKEQNISKKRRTAAENNNNTKNNNGRIIIKLYCPKVSKIGEIIAWEDQRLDLGAIATVFGFEPKTLKLNGHFISRGIDFIASSVTWVSLFSFFSKKGLSTGLHSDTALLVDGKLVKSGSKRTREPQEVDRGIHCTKQGEEEGICKYSHQDINLPKYKKLKDNGFDKANIHKACCGSGNNEYNFDGGRMCGAPGVMACPNPALRVSWDGIHLTEHAYQVMAAQLLKQILPALSFYLIPSDP